MQILMNAPLDFTIASEIRTAAIQMELLGVEYGLLLVRHRNKV